jgi:ubiquinone/menaquinone biosynthesis C-methylase UbiE
LASKGAQVEGADISEPMLKIAREASSEKIVFHLIKNAKLPPGRTYDAITTVFTLCNMESFSDVQSNLAACHKALKAGGKLVILESDFLRSAGKDFPTFSVDEKPPLREDQRLTLQLKIPPMSSLTVFNWHRTAERYAQALEKAGFRNTQVKRIGDSFPQTPYMVIWAEK